MQTSNGLEQDYLLSGFLGQKDFAYSISGRLKAAEDIVRSPWIEYPKKILGDEISLQLDDLLDGLLVNQSVEDWKKIGSG